MAQAPPEPQPPAERPARAGRRSAGATARSWLRALHRDIGFLCVGLTVVYAVSGVAVNHHHDWDYNYRTDVTPVAVGTPAALLGVPPGDPAAALPPGQLARERQEALVAALLAALGRTDRPYTAFWSGPDRFSLLFGKADFDVVDYAPSTGVATRNLKTERPLLRPFNWLHLNEGRGAWTWVADGYAVLLFFLAISGAVLVKGRRGLWGRGGILLLLGILLPLLGALLLR